MKIIKVACACGATAEFHDDKSDYVVGGYQNGDANGDRFMIQSAARQWQERHIDCAKLYAPREYPLFNVQGETK